MNTRPKWFVIVLPASFAAMCALVALSGPAWYLLIVGWRLPQDALGWMLLMLMLLGTPTGAYLAVKFGSVALKFAGVMSGEFKTPKLGREKRSLAVACGSMALFAGLFAVIIASPGLFQHLGSVVLAAFGFFQMLMGICMCLWGLDEIMQERRVQRDRDPL